jgi:DNA-binding CsgD family transcriptional regulator
MKKLTSSICSVAAFTFFSAWLISFPYEGQVLYSLLARYKIFPSYWILGAITAHLAGLVSCMCIAKDILRAKRVMLVSASICFGGSALFFLPYTIVFLIALIAISFFAGLFICAWAFFFREYTPPGGRMHTAAITLSLSALIMIGINLCCLYVSDYLAFGICMALMAAVILLVCRTDAASAAPASAAPATAAKACVSKNVSYIRPFVTLCAFILVITINSGLMFQVILPAFGSIGLVADIYWAIPYIAAILIVNRFPARINKGYILYVAIAMLGFAFITFVALDRSTWSYVAVNTLLLGACGINDLFWWSILGELLDFDKNPARTFGIGLSANVMGVLLGKLIGLAPVFAASDGSSALVGMAIVCVALVLLPPMHKQLSHVIINNAFLATLSALAPERQKKTVSEVSMLAGLSERENEIVLLLLKGYTYKLIASELYISESTVKTHIQSIYSKLNIHNRTELIQKINRDK